MKIFTILLTFTASVAAEDLFIMEQMALTDSDVPVGYTGDPFEYEGWTEGWLAGERVAIEGNLAAISARRYLNDNDEVIGAVFTYEKVGGDWIFRQRIDGVSGTNGPVEFGKAIQINDGILFVGAPNFYGGIQANQIGAVATYSWQNSTKTWNQSLSLAQSAEDDARGANIAINDQMIAVAGLTGKAVHVYQFPTATTTSQRITPPAGVTRFGEQEIAGQTLAIDADLLVVASPFDPTTAGNGLGTVSCYENINGNYVWQQNLTTPSPRQQQVFGYSIAMLDDTLVDGYSIQPDGNGGMIQASRNPNTQPVTDYFGADEQDRYDEFFALVRKRLGTQISNWSELNNLYLDMVYDRAQVDILRANEALVDLERNRLEAPEVINGSYECVIDREIAAYTAAEGALPLMRSALNILRSPLTDHVDNFTVNPPIGFTKFINEQPFRALAAPQFLENGTPTALNDGNGTPITSDLLNTHKDAALFFETLAEHGRMTADLAELYLLKGDETAAKDALVQARELAFFQGNPVRERLRDQNTGEDPAALKEALLNWEESLAELTTAEDSFNTGLNPLGFDPNFLVILRDRKAGEENIEDTFDVLENRLADNTDDTNKLKLAKDTRIDALNQFDTYYSGITKLNERLSSINNDAVVRLVDIVGVGPTDPTYDSIPGPNNSTDGGFINGSELWDQFQNIRRARLQISRNSSEITNLEERVRIEVERNLFEVGQQNAIKSIRISYGNQQANLEVELGQLHAAQAYADILADSLNPANWAEVVGNAVNAGVQVYGELRQGEIAAEQERLAASEEAAVIDAQNRILNANSAALIETWMLDMKVLVINSWENAIILQQETGQLIALLRERKTLERRIEVHDTSLLNRYFADPVHRARYLSQTYLAHRRFDEAQQLLFLAARALSYKMNSPFDNVMNGTGYTLNSIYKARNAFELDLIFQAMVGANNNNIGYDFPEDTFSLKQDAFGYVENGGTYTDPQTGAQVSATQAFQSLLQSPGVISGDLASDNFVQIVLDFSTVRDPLNTFHGADFFRGSRLTQINANTGDVELIDPSTPSNAGSYLDKIVELAISIPGAHTTGATETNIGITYRGTSIVRARNLGKYNRFDPADPFSDFRRDRLIDESISIPVRASTFEDNIWKSNDFLTASPGARLTTNNAPRRTRRAPRKLLHHQLPRAQRRRHQLANRHHPQRRPTPSQPHPNRRHHHPLPS